jgi:hypothetical protein
MTPLGIEPATCRLVAEYLKQLRHRTHRRIEDLLLFYLTTSLQPLYNLFLLLLSFSFFCDFLSILLLALFCFVLHVPLIQTLHCNGSKLPVVTNAVTRLYLSCEQRCSVWMSLGIFTNSLFNDAVPYRIFCRVAVPAWHMRDELERILCYISEFSRKLLRETTQTDRDANWIGNSISELEILISISNVILQITFYKSKFI